MKVQYVCEICKTSYPTELEAKACEARGKKHLSPQEQAEDDRRRQAWASWSRDCIRSGYGPDGEGGM